MTAPVHDPYRLVGWLLDDKYRVDAVIGAGGFAVVYRAVDQRLERTVALKVLTAHVDPRLRDDDARRRFLDSFEREAKLAASLSDRNIVQIFEWGESEMPSGARAPWMALEWIEGTTLEADLNARRGGGGRGVAETLKLLAPLLEAVAHAHERHVVHRDLKPGNVMLTARGLRLLDFGIAKMMEAAEPAAGSGNTRTRVPPLGLSPAYAAPEQFNYGRTGPWTDVYALALIVTEVLTDRAPYDPARDQYEEAVAALRPTPRKLGYDAGALEAVLARAVAIVPSERPADARALLDELVAAAGGERERERGSIAPAPVEPSRPPSPPAARQPIASALVLAAAAVIAGGVGVGVWIQRMSSSASEPALPPAVVTPAAPRVESPAADPLADAQRACDGAAGPERDRGCEAACNGGAAKACVALAASLTADAKLPRAERHRRAARAVELYQRACDAASAEGCFALALAWRDGTGVVADPERFIRFAQRACDGGRAAACTALGSHYDEVHRSGAVDLLLKGCDGGDVAGCAAAASHYRYGVGVPDVDRARAAALYRKACDAREGFSCWSLGRLFLEDETGQIPGSSGGAASGLFHDACDYGEARGCSAFGEALAGSDGEQAKVDAVGFFRKGCDGGDRDGCLGLAGAYDHGRGVKTDASKAVRYYRKACAANLPAACGRLGVLLRDGTGVEQDAALGCNMMKKACDDGDRASCEAVSHDAFCDLR